MKIVRNMSFYVGAAASLFFGPALTGCAPTFAQTNTTQSPLPVTTPATTAKVDFAEHFARLAQKNKLLIVAEDLPLSPSVSVKDAPNLAIFTTSPQRDVRQHALVFDYESLNLTTNVAVLKKRYEKPGDLPFVTLDEARTALKSIQKMVEPFKSPLSKYADFSLDRKFWETIDSFTPAQLALMKENNLPVSALTPAQREQMWSLMLNYYIDEHPVLHVQTTLRDFDFVLDCNGWLRFISAPADETQFAYEFEYINRNVPMPTIGYGTIPLFYERTKRRVAGGIQSFPTNRDGDGKILPFHDAGEPTVEDITKAQELNTARKSPFVFTLKAITDSVTQQTQGKMVFLVDDALAPKPVFVFGKENATPEQLFRACASAYGLRVVEETSEPAEEKKAVRQLRLTMPFAPKPRTLEELPEAVRRLIPDPYVRALHLPEMVAYNKHIEAINVRVRREKVEREARRAQGENIPEPVLTDAERQNRKKGFEYTLAN